MTKKEKKIKGGKHKYILKAILQSHFEKKMSATYTVLHLFMQVLFWAGNQSNHQNFDPSLLSYKC